METWTIIGEVAAILLVVGIGLWLHFVVEAHRLPPPPDDPDVDWP